MKIEMEKIEIETFCPTSPADWRQWLEKNHASKQSIWLVYYKKKAGLPTLSWSEAVDQALCFGWIDSTAKPIDATQYRQFFSKRKPKSVWSKVNKGKVNSLIDNELMTEAGFKSIEIAKQNGAWIILDEVEELIIPEDLEKAFYSQSGSRDYFTGLSKSVRKAMLHRLVLAKLTETRQKRINEIINSISEKLKPK